MRLKEIIVIPVNERSENPQTLGEKGMLDCRELLEKKMTLISRIVRRENLTNAHIR